MTDPDGLTCKTPARCATCPLHHARLGCKLEADLRTLLVARRAGPLAAWTSGAPVATAPAPA